jgi:uncharacterized protein YndB with AHSA1/START domain
MKWLLVFGGLAAAGAALLGVLTLVGSRLPRDHVASRRALIRRPPAEVFAAIQDFGRAAEWRGDVKRVSVLGEVGGRLRFREEGAHGAMTLEVMELVPGERLVTRIADPELPFGGTWTYELKPAAAGTEIEITERGFVKPALFRALARYVFGHHRTLEQYLRALGKRFGEDVAPAPGAAAA